VLFALGFETEEGLPTSSVARFRPARGGMALEQSDQDWSNDDGDETDEEEDNEEDDEQDRAFFLRQRARAPNAAPRMQLARRPAAVPGYTYRLALGAWSGYEGMRRWW
jgi:hypothetical protein